MLRKRGHGGARADREDEGERLSDQAAGWLGESLLQRLTHALMEFCTIS